MHSVNMDGYGFFVCVQRRVKDVQSTFRRRSRRPSQTRARRPREDAVRLQTSCVRAVRIGPNQTSTLCRPGEDQTLFCFLLILKSRFLLPLTLLEVYSSSFFVETLVPGHSNHKNHKNPPRTIKHCLLHIPLNCYWLWCLCLEKALHRNEP